MVVCTAIVLVESLSRYFHETLQKYKAPSDDVQTTRSVTLVYLFFGVIPLLKFDDSFVSTI